MESIDSESTTAQKKKTLKLSLLRTQVNIRKKVLGQNIHIIFTHARKQRPVGDIVEELADFIDNDTLSSENSEYIQNPSALVARRIRHRFENEGNICDRAYEKGP